MPRTIMGAWTTLLSSSPGSLDRLTLEESRAVNLLGTRLLAMPSERPTPGQHPRRAFSARSPDRDQ